MPASVRIQLIGIEKVQQALTAGGVVARRVESALTDAMIKAGEDLVGRAQRIAPLDEGTLRASGTVAVFSRGRRVHFEAPGGAIRGQGKSSPIGASAMATLEGGDSHTITAQVGFNTPYALEQHERIDFRHTHGQAKYLSTPLHERTGIYRKFFEAAVAEALR